MYGIQAVILEDGLKKKFENDVKMYSMQARYNSIRICFLCIVYSKDVIGKCHFNNLRIFQCHKKDINLYKLLHYLILIRISNKDEQLALSRDKDEVMRLALEGQVIEPPEDVLKILMFWNLQDFLKWYHIRKRQLL